MSVLSSFERTSSQFSTKSLVAIAKRSHPFPYRTRKLSSSAPMVVGVSPCKSRTLPSTKRVITFKVVTLFVYKIILQL